MKYVTTCSITIPPGTLFEVTDELGDGGLEMVSDQRFDTGCVRVFMGRAAALRAGLVQAKPTLLLVEGVTP